MKRLYVNVTIPAVMDVSDDFDVNVKNVKEALAEWDRVYWKDQINYGNYSVKVTDVEDVKED